MLVFSNLVTQYYIHPIIFWGSTTPYFHKSFFQSTNVYLLDIQFFLMQIQYSVIISNFYVHPVMPMHT